MYVWVWVGGGCWACPHLHSLTGFPDQIFLENRSNSDVLRNAMVGVFLRKLEYHQGVLFLTTNRVKAFDSAFNSRINVALRYHDLDKEARRQGESPQPWSSVRMWS